MNKSTRILLAIFIGILGILNVIPLVDLIYRFIFMDLDIKKYFDLEAIFETIISMILVLSVIPAVTFHIRIVKSAKIDKDLETKTTNQTTFKFSRATWNGNILFGFASIILGIQILRVTISEHLMLFNEKYRDYANVKYYNYLIAIIIVIVGLKIIIDVKQIKKLATTRGIANKGFSGMRSSSPASIFRLG
jgi:hypothetical protein